MNSDLKEDAELRAFTNRHAVRSASAQNAVNATNDRYYEAALEGLVESPALTYLLNLGGMSLKDYRSIGAYNAMNTAATIASHRSMEEIEDSTTIALPRPKSLRTRLTDAIDERRSVRRFGGSPSAVSTRAPPVTRRSSGL